MKAERDSILRFYEPYYTIDEEVEKNAIAEFDADVNLNTKLSNLPPDYILYLRNGLQKIYRSGIMRSDDYDKIFASETQSLRLKKGTWPNQRVWRCSAPSNRHTSSFRQYSQGNGR